MKIQLLSILIPTYNEEKCILLLHEQLSKIIEQLTCKIEILFVNDGSTDNSLLVIKELQKTDPHVQYLDLSRNFGKEIAICAGIDYIKGDALVIMDADLQHPPELIIQMISEIEAGYDDVFARCVNRKQESALKRLGAKLYYKLLHSLSNIPIQENAGDFRMFSEKAITALRTIKETERNMKILYSYIGFNKKAINYIPHKRIAGETKWNYFKLTELAIKGITSFSVIPLRIVSFLGILVSISAFVYLLIVLTKYIIWGDPVKGYPTLVCIILFIGGIILLALGMIGEYLGVIYNETKKRPIYIVKEYH